MSLLQPHLSCVPILPLEAKVDTKLTHPSFIAAKHSKNKAPGHTRSSFPRKDITHTYKLQAIPSPPMTAQFAMELKKPSHATPYPYFSKLFSFFLSYIPSFSYCPEKSNPFIHPLALIRTWTPTWFLSFRSSHPFIQSFILVYRTTPVSAFPKQLLLQSHLIETCECTTVTPPSRPPSISFKEQAKEESDSS